MTPFGVRAFATAIKRDVARFDIELTAVRVFIIHFVYGIVIPPPMPPFMGMAAQ